MLFVESKIGTFGRFRGYLHFKSVASAAASYCYLLLLLPLLLAEQRRLHSAGFSCAASCINIIVLLLLLQYIRDLKGREREREREGRRRVWSEFMYRLGKVQVKVRYTVARSSTCCCLQPAERVLFVHRRVHSDVELQQTPTASSSSSFSSYYCYFNGILFLSLSLSLKKLLYISKLASCEPGSRWPSTVHSSSSCKSREIRFL